MQEQLDASTSINGYDGGSPKNLISNRNFDSHRRNPNPLKEVDPDQSRKSEIEMLPVKKDSQETWKKQNELVEMQRFGIESKIGTKSDADCSSESDVSSIHFHCKNFRMYAHVQKSMCSDVKANGSQSMSRMSLTADLENLWNEAEDFCGADSESGVNPI